MALHGAAVPWWRVVRAAVGLLAGTSRGRSKCCARGDADPTVGDSAWLLASAAGPCGPFPVD